MARRCKDTSGWQPSRFRIDDSLPLDARLQTDLPVDQLAGACRAPCSPTCLLRRTATQGHVVALQRPAFEHGILASPFASSAQA